MINTDFTPIERIDRNFTVLIKIKDHGSMVYDSSFLFGSKTKCYKYLCSIGTVYGKRIGREFQRPLLTYKTFCEFIKKNNLVHVASTGSFDGRFIIQNQKCL
jgi:hypothetical protein